MAGRQEDNSREILFIQDFFYSPRPKNALYIQNGVRDQKDILYGGGAERKAFYERHSVSETVATEG